MKIVYHHRTRSTDAQRIHIQEMVRAFESQGHEVEVVSLVPLDSTSGDPHRDASEALWKRMARRIPFAYEVALLGYNMVGLLLLLARIVRNRPDFLYERYALFNFAGVIAARLCRIPLVLEVNSPFALEQSRDREIRSRRFAAWTEAWICNMADRVIVVSTPLARLMRSAGVRSEKLEVMPNGIAPERFHPRPAPAELRERLGLTGHMVIGFVGWFRSWHGLDLLLEAFHRSGLAAEPVKLLLIGDGPAMRDLQESVRTHGLGQSVVFTGPLPHSEVPPYLGLIDIAVQPAANEYCCPMKLIEYLALGKPIVAPAQENIQELVSEKEAALFTPRDAGSLARVLRSLACDAERVREMGRNAHRAIAGRRLLWTANAGRVVEMVEWCQAARQELPMNPRETPVKVPPSF